MLNRDIRAAILTLHEQGRGIRAIARAVGVTRRSVKRVLQSGSADVPLIERDEKAEPYEQQIRELFSSCEGNQVRVHEELQAKGIHLAYSTLTSFCRRRGIGQTPKERAGRYHFEPGQEMQHDTSPHHVKLGEQERRLHCASLVLCYSRMLFAQLYAVWNRFWARVFLVEAVKFFQRVAGSCMVDNLSVIVARGTGAEAVIAPEMEALSKHLRFKFIAHEVGDVNRSARVERPFDHIEHNFYPGRKFADLTDANTQLRAWCERVNAKPKKDLGTSPLSLFATEQTALKPLPNYIPPIYQLHRRTVDVEGYIHLHTNRYSLPTELIDRDVSVHETKDQVRIFDGHRLVCEHVRQEDGLRKRCTLPGHEKQPRWRKPGAPYPPSPEEQQLRADSAVLAQMVDALQKRHGGRATRKLQRLHRLWLDYPAEPLRSALAVALEYGLFDLDRIESLVLRHVAGEFFRLPTGDDDDDHDHEQSDPDGYDSTSRRGADRDDQQTNGGGQDPTSRRDDNNPSSRDEDNHSQGDDEET